MDDVIQIRTITCDTIEEYGKTISLSLDGEAIQLTPGKFGSHAICAFSQNAALLRELISASSQSFARLPPDFVAFGVPDRRTRELGRYWNSVHPEDGLAFCSAGDSADLLLPQDSVKVIALVNETVFLSKFEALTGRSWEAPEKDMQFIRVSEEARTALGNSMDRLLREFSEEKCGTGDFLETTLVELIAEAVPTEVKFMTTASKKRELVEHAIFLAKSSNFKRPLAGICLDLGCSRKLLEMAFKECKDCTPSHYIKLLRLNHCRELLFRADPGERKVSEIAESVGLKWSGYFAAQYFEFFDEFPKHTLNRRSSALQNAQEVG